MKERETNVSDAAPEYRAKTLHELSAVARAMKSSGHPEPLGDPLSGVMILLSQPVGPRALDAISRSLTSIDLDAYVTFSSTDLLSRQLLLVEPSVLAAIGPEAANEIDGLQHPLASNDFSTAREGNPFPWKKTTTGILLPPLAPALDDDDEKRRFWRSFLTLRTLR